MVSLARIKAPNLLLLRILTVVAALVLLWTVVNLCVDRGYFCCTVCVGCCYSSCNICVVCLFCFTALLVGLFVVTYVTLSALYVGFCIPLCRVLYPSRRVLYPSRRVV